MLLERNRTRTDEPPNADISRQRFIVSHDLIQPAYPENALADALHVKGYLFALHAAFERIVFGARRFNYLRRQKSKNT
jgi:hypothetical protein